MDGRAFMEVRLLDGMVVGGEVEFRGLDMGNAKPMTVKGYNIRTGVVIIKVPSGSHWASHGVTASHSGHYEVRMIEEIKPSGDPLKFFRAWTQPVLEFPLR
tara:strand:- start:1140 stop:1442 length:303 start_codon:yes stop_codon:yes gene_type:complete